MLMEKILFCFVLAVAVAEDVDENLMPGATRVDCTNEFTAERNKLIDQTACGEPKEVFEYLDINAAHEQVRPRAVWVKRCVNLCEFDKEGRCEPTETRIRDIHIRIYNLKTDKETCATYPITEHVSCGCVVEQ